jgi:hypothetical protein
MGVCETEVDTSNVVEHYDVLTVCESRSNTFIAKDADIIFVM